MELKGKVAFISGATRGIGIASLHGPMILLAKIGQTSQVWMNTIDELPLKFSGGNRCNLHLRIDCECIAHLYEVCDED